MGRLSTTECTYLPTYLISRVTGSQCLAMCLGAQICATC